MLMHLLTLMLSMAEPSLALQAQHLTAMKDVYAGIKTEPGAGRPGLRVTHLHFPVQGVEATALLGGSGKFDLFGNDGFCFKLDLPIEAAEQIGSALEDTCRWVEVLDQVVENKLYACSAFPVPSGTYCVEGSLSDLTHKYVMMETQMESAPANLLEGHLVYVHTPTDGRFDTAVLSSQIAQAAVAAGQNTTMLVAKELYDSSKEALSKIGIDGAIVQLHQFRNPCTPDKNGLGGCGGKGDYYHKGDIKITNSFHPPY